MTAPERTGEQMLRLARGGTEADSRVQSEDAAQALAKRNDRPSTNRPERPEYENEVVHVLASKILMDWLRNRQQTLFPFSLDLRKLEPPQVQVLIEAMVTAAHADGVLDGKEHDRVEAALSLLKAGEEQRAALGPAFDKPKPLHEILTRVSDVQTGAIVYAGSLLALDRRKPVNRYYLRYLAARLQLPSELARSLEQRFRAAV